MASDLTLPLHEIIGIPISDIVRGEMQAAQASMEFIQNVGFRRAAKSDSDDLGDMRFVTFRYQTPGTSGMTVGHKVRVPLLSLVPLPMLQVASAQVELAARIESVKSMQVDSTVVSKAAGHSETLVAQRHEFLASVDSLAADGDTRATSSPRIRIKIELRQSDVPAGVSALLRKLDTNVFDKVSS